MALTKEEHEELEGLVHSLKYHCGEKAREDFKQACIDNGIKDHPFFCREYTKEYLEIARKVFAVWHTVNKFKVGDKVYVVPLFRPSVSMTNCIRAVVTDVDEKYGYWLRAFRKDNPGIHMYNIWDKDLETRTNKKNKPIPTGLQFLV